MRLSESYFPKRNLAWAHASSPAWSTYGRQGVQVPACNIMGSIRSELQLIYELICRTGLCIIVMRHFGLSMHRNHLHIVCMYVSARVPAPPNTGTPNQI